MSVSDARGFFFSVNIFNNNNFLTVTLVFGFDKKLLVIIVII